jgi:hypothetical protein
MEAMASKAPTLPLLGGLRKRTRSGVDYKDMDVSLENSSDETDALRKMRKGTRARIGRGVPTIDEEPQGLDTDIKQWSDRELKRLEDQLFALGRGRTGKSFWGFFEHNSTHGQYFALLSSRPSYMHMSN